jgi:hypothetical protein
MKKLFFLFSVLGILSSGALMIVWAGSVLKIESNGKFDNYKFTGNAIKDYTLFTVIHEDGDDTDSFGDSFESERFHAKAPGFTGGFLFSCLSFIQMIIWLLLNHAVFMKILNEEGHIIINDLQIDKNNVTALSVLTIWNGTLITGLFLLGDYSKYF